MESEAIWGLFLGKDTNANIAQYFGPGIDMLRDLWGGVPIKWGAPRFQGLFEAAGLRLDHGAGDLLHTPVLLTNNDGNAFASMMGIPSASSAHPDLMTYASKQDFQLFDPRTGA